MSQKNFDQEKIQSKKILGPEKFGSKKGGPENISTKKIKVQKMWDLENFCAKIFLCPKHFELKF